MIPLADKQVASVMTQNLSILPHCNLVPESKNRKINYLEPIVSTNKNYNQVNDVVYNELKFYSSNSLSNNIVKDPLHIVTLRLRTIKWLDRP